MTRGPTHRQQQGTSRHPAHRPGAHHGGAPTGGHERHAPAHEREPKHGGGQHAGHKYGRKG